MLTPTMRHTPPPVDGPRTRQPIGVLLGVVLTFCGVLVLNVYHLVIGAHEEHEPSLPVHLLRDGGLATPGTVGAVVTALWLSRRLVRRFPGAGPTRRRALAAAMTAAAAAAALAAGSPVHEVLFGAHEPVELPWPLHLLQEAVLALVATLPVAWALVPVPGGSATRAGGHPDTVPTTRSPQRRRAVLGTVAALVVVGSLASATVARAATGDGGVHSPSPDVGSVARTQP